MKLLSVVAASAVGSMIATASVLPAYANDPEPVLYVRNTVDLTSESEAEIESSDDLETATAEAVPTGDEVVPEDEAEPESESSAPADEVETQTPIAPETQRAPSTGAPNDAATQVEESPLRESLKLFSVVPVEVPPGDGSTVPTEVSVAEAVVPPRQNSAPEPARSQNQPPAAGAARPSAEEPATEAGSSPLMGAGAEDEVVPAEQDRAQTVDEEPRDIPPEPREISTIDPTEIGEENNSPEAGDKTPKETAPTNRATEHPNTGREDNHIESAERPSDRPLSETGATSAALAMGGAVFLAVGVTLVARRLRLGQSEPRGRHGRRD